ncbi:DNA-protecting protein DprA [Candidatus Peregrinibacteria bacterium]|nr:DNA-protecting protein DprA [Candidatus Peregrinibacteria bacterium]
MQKITQSSEFYPASLRHISHPPTQLYIEGNAAALNNFCIAVVGTRRPSPYGKMQTRLITDFLAKNNVTIVSGFAHGIDIISHETALKNSTPTIAVLGSGLENIYPASHKKYIDDIIKTGGAIITEYEPTEEPLKFHFPQRNRIIAGISEAVVVVEAPEKSGSLITAKLALEYNKDIFAVPCDIDRKIGIGAIRAIQSCGAYPIISPEEIFEQMNLQIKIPFMEAPDICPTGMPKNALAVYSALSKKSPKTIDDLANETYLTAPEISHAISILEIQGLIEKIGAGIIRK